jgi:hypothetical protein
VDLAARFRTVLDRAWPRVEAQWELLPAALAETCTHVLPIDGAGISLTQNVRVPLAFSDDHAAEAERLQITLGDGPCLTAAQTRRPVVADLESMKSRWPLFQRQLVAKTPYRSVASVPLRANRMPAFGAMDLYSTQPDASAFPELEQLETGIARTASRVLLAAPTVVDPVGSVRPA